MPSEADTYGDRTLMRRREHWAICPGCGADYYIWDTKGMCYPCAAVAHLRRQLRWQEAWQAERKAKYGHRIPAVTVEAEG